MLTLAVCVYLANVGLGLVAQFTGRRFGLWHHAAYAVVFGTALLATVLEFHPGLLLTLAALACFPKAKPRTWAHPLLAVIGLVGYAVSSWPR